MTSKGARPFRCLAPNRAKLSLKAKESQAVDLLLDDIDNSKTLVAKFFTKRHPNMEAINQTLRSMWRSGGSFKIWDLGENTVLLLFEDVADANRIFMQGPWSFNKYLIGLYRPREEATVNGATLDKASFWVQIHGLPLRLMWKENDEAIGSTLGRMECIEETKTGDCRGHCIRMRVDLDITQPLYRGRLVQEEGNHNGFHSNMSGFLFFATSVVS